jgi:hypothetical protein
MLSELADLNPCEEWRCHPQNLFSSFNVAEKARKYASKIVDVLSNAQKKSNVLTSEGGSFIF